MASTSVALLLVLAGLALNIAAGQLCRNNLTSFVFESFDCLGDRHLKCTGDCTCTAEGQVNLTSYDMKSWGRLMYSPGIRLMDPVSNRVASFRTNFTFNMGGEYSRPGEGMAFVMQGNPDYQGHGGGFLGLYNKDGKAGTPTLAIEFDTYRDWFYGFFRYNDINSNHVGLDIESINSKLQVDAGVFGIDLAKERTVTAWIDYVPPTENFDGNLQVRISADTTRPLLALISYDVDLSKHISEIMYMGFTATTGDWCLSYHSILSWSFESWGLVPPTPPPAPSAPTPNLPPSPSVLPPIPLPPEPPSPSAENPPPPPPPSPAPPAPPAPISPLPPPPESPTAPPPVPSLSPPAPHPEIPPSPAPSPAPSPSPSSLPNSTVPVPSPPSAPSPSVSPPPAVPPSLPPHEAEPSLPPESTPTPSAGPSPSSHEFPPAPASIPTPSAAPSPSSYIPPPASLPPVPTPSSAPSPGSHVYPPAPQPSAPASSPTPSGYSPSPSPDFPSLPPAPSSHSAPIPSPGESPLEPPSSASPPATFPPSELPPMYPPAGPPSSPPSVTPGLSPSLTPSPDSNMPPTSEPPSPTSLPAPAPTPEQGRADATRSMMVSVGAFALLVAGYVTMIWRKVQREVRDAHSGHGEDGYLLIQSVGGLWPFSR
ncbi:hypothetical protein MPTK1_3g16760 [Marchantia polymorpha subsp. ruderalis]|uniref:Legume lectin domain-containing protein n=2 Tax=Marchantia polymorpha TaxID=3197 RepID=A0AAF6B1K8_MARPO|nr:hypothetical protein MARPO_0039s0119 [Marchantia polymorpha]BBN05892.1 hypothetical protein Mp_3g16760 [Marchantia polymorpha subsp. ruderalis]|eukprot:PTQ40633.1 hypothetical protein MARPO_0039s0119 [Marchantia polymorpha]